MKLQKPLLFIQGPPVIIRVTAKTEESTSIYDKPDALYEPVEVDAAPAAVQNPAILKKLHYLHQPFRKQTYRPLQFELENEHVLASLEKLDEEQVWVQLHEEDTIITIAITDIKEIHWRGKPFEV